MALDDGGGFAENEPLDFVPFEEIRGAFRHYYPRMTAEQEAMPLGGRLEGDFAAEGETEAKTK